MCTHARVAAWESLCVCQAKQHCTALIRPGKVVAALLNSDSSL